MKDKAKLTRKVITNKTGHRQTVWVTTDTPKYVTVLKDIDKWVDNYDKNKKEKRQDKKVFNLGDGVKVNVDVRKKTYQGNTHTEIDITAYGQAKTRGTYEQKMYGFGEGYLEKWDGHFHDLDIHEVSGALATIKKRQKQILAKQHTKKHHTDIHTTKKHIQNLSDKRKMYSNNSGDVVYGIDKYNKMIREHIDRKIAEYKGKLGNLELKRKLNQ